MPTESKKESHPNEESRAAERRDYFCTICLEGFHDRESLEAHMKTHRELEVKASSCKMAAQPAGVA